MPARFAFLLLTTTLSACVSSEKWEGLPAGQDAYQTIPATRPAGSRPEYRINVQDTLNITVFREPDMSVEAAPVETGGTLVLPLIGRVVAAGKTTEELSKEIQSVLASRYLVDPRVSVIVMESRAQNVTVDGAVNTPGVYGLQGDTTLLQAIALARGATRTATFDKVAIFRHIDGKRYGALFDMGEIRAGRLEDPILQSGDYVVVGTSGAKALGYDLLTLAPAAGLFVQLLN
ncbi:polysaccharide biosynthesis/export family protein [Sphingomonas sp. R86521]|uniref:polysaccharide biosynthesis/export family protein n=1 Tax=Sphingomonas sp. R86521 TaxID=3093860 RepID=UPI0036D3FEDC